MESMVNSDKYPYFETGSRLKSFRETTGMNIKDFTELCGFNYTRYINWETGHRRMQPDEAVVLCEKFGLTMDFIYRGIEAQLPHNILMALSSKPRDKAQRTSNDNPD